MQSLRMFPCHLFYLARTDISWWKDSFNTSNNLWQDYLNVGQSATCSPQRKASMGGNENKDLYTDKNYSCQAQILL